MSSQPTIHECIPGYLRMRRKKKNWTYICEPPHSLHWLFWRLREQMPCRAKAFLASAPAQLCSHICVPQHSVHRVLMHLCSHICPLRCGPSVPPPAGRIVFNGGCREPSPRVHVFPSFILPSPATLALGTVVLSVLEVASVRSTCRASLLLRHRECWPRASDPANPERVPRASSVDIWARACS